MSMKEYIDRVDRGKSQAEIALSLSRLSPRQIRELTGYACIDDLLRDAGVNVYELQAGDAQEKLNTILCSVDSDCSAQELLSAVP